MKRLAAIVVSVVLLALPVCAQRGGSHGGGFSGAHGGFSGSHGGFSAPHGGFSAPHGGFSGHPAPPFHGGSTGFRGFAPGRVSAPHYVGNRAPYSGLRPVGPRIPVGLRPVGPRPNAPRQPYSDLAHGRMPYHSPNASNRHDRDRDRDRDRDHDRFGRFVFYTWAGIPWWPLWGWGYPYLPDYFDYPDQYDSQPDSNYAAAQPSPDYSGGPYEPRDQVLPDQAQPYTAWPSSQPVPDDATFSPALSSEAPVTLVFKDGRAPEQIHNYLLTASTLSVLDQHRRDIPVDQIDLTATAKVNREAGIEFALPGDAR